MEGFEPTLIRVLLASCSRKERRTAPPYPCLLVFHRQVPRVVRGSLAVCFRPSLVSKPFTPVARCHWPALSWAIMASRKAYTPKPPELFCHRPCRRHPFLSGRALKGSYIAELVPRVDNLFLCRIEKRLFLSQYVKELMSLRTVRCALIQHVPVIMQEAHLGLLWKA